MFCKNQMFHSFHTYLLWGEFVLDNDDRYLSFIKKRIKFESWCNFALNTPRRPERKVNGVGVFSRR